MKSALFFLSFCVLFFVFIKQKNASNLEALNLKTKLKLTLYDFFRTTAFIGSNGHEINTIC